MIEKAIFHDTNENLVPCSRRLSNYEIDTFSKFTMWFYISQDQISFGRSKISVCWRCEKKSTHYEGARRNVSNSRQRCIDCILKVLIKKMHNFKMNFFTSLVFVFYRHTSCIAFPLHLILIIWFLTHSTISRLTIKTFSHITIF